MAKISTIKQLGDQICTSDYLGFAPTSNSTKPPHVANGLFRECVGETCNTSDFHRWITDEQKIKDPELKKNFSPKGIISDYKEILTKGERTSEMKVKMFRTLLNELFNPDNTAYGSEEFSSYNISSHWLLKKRIAAEGGIGNFLYTILATPLKGKESPMLDLVRYAVKSSTDNLTKLILPIIVYPTPNDKLTNTSVNEVSTEWDDWKLTIREGFDVLAQNLKLINETNNPLMVQKRTVCYACFATFLYLANSNAAQFNGKSRPIFIDAGANCESIKKASEQTFTMAKTSVEDYYVNAIKQILLKEGIKDDDKACRDYIDDMQYKNTEEQKNIEPRIIEQYANFRNDFCPIEALAHALQFILYTFEYKANSPSDFCRVLGVRCGLVGPKGNRAKIKRYIINSFLLETLTLSVLTEDDLMEGIEMKEVGMKLTKAYGILFGFNDELEYPLLEENNITRFTPGDLRGDMSLNSQCVSDTYISLGLGHRYADGVTILKWNM